MARPKKKRYSTIAATFAAALAIGFVMQYGDAVASRLGGSDEPVSGPDARMSEPIEELIPVSASLATPQAFEIPSIVIKSVATVTLDSVPSEEAAPIIDEHVAAQLPSCEPFLRADAIPGAMISVEMHAACRPNALVSFIHNELRFQLSTDEVGHVAVDIPALDADGIVTVAFDDNETITTSAEVTDIIMYDRAVLQWRGESIVELHALEFGATYGEEGHIWSAATGNSFAAAIGAGGSLVRLGSPDLPNAVVAEVYTYPTGMTSREGGVALSVEAEVTTRNCGREVAARTIQVRPTSKPQVEGLSMTMPGCDAIGEYLVLKNMFEDLTLALK